MVTLEEARKIIARVRHQHEGPREAFAVRRAVLRHPCFSDMDDAERYGRDGLKVTEALAHAEDASADVGEALLRLAQVRRAQGSTAEARELLMRAVRCLTNGFDEKHTLTREARDLLQQQ